MPALPPFENKPTLKRKYHEVQSLLAATATVGKGVMMSANQVGLRSSSVYGNVLRELSPQSISSVAAASAASASASASAAAFISASASASASASDSPLKASSTENGFGSFATMSSIEHSSQLLAIKPVIEQDIVVKKQRKTKTVSWVPDERLCKVKIYDIVPEEKINPNLMLIAGPENRNLTKVNAMDLDLDATALAPLVFESSSAARSFSQGVTNKIDPQNVDARVGAHVAQPAQASIVSTVSTVSTLPIVSLDDILTKIDTSLLSKINPIVISNALGMDTNNAAFATKNVLPSPSPSPSLPSSPPSLLSPPSLPSSSLSLPPLSEPLPLPTIASAAVPYQVPSIPQFIMALQQLLVANIASMPLENASKILESLQNLQLTATTNTSNQVSAPATPVKLGVPFVPGGNNNRCRQQLERSRRNPQVSPTRRGVYARMKAQPQVTVTENI